ADEAPRGGLSRAVRHCEHLSMKSRYGLITGPIDLVVLGDSFGAEWGTTQDRIFSQVLATRYGRCVYNLSFPGGPYDQYVNFAIEAPRLTLTTPATVVWTLYTGNDLDDAAGQTWEIEALPWQSGFHAWRVSYRTFRNRSPINRLLEGLRNRLKGNTGQVFSRTLPNGLPVLFRPSEESWSMKSRQEVEQVVNFPNLVRTLHAMKQLTDERGLALVVFILPTKGDVYRWIFEQREPQPEDAHSSGVALAVLAVCEKAHLQCFDTKPYLVQEGRWLFESSGQLLWWRDDTHLGEHGHAAVAAFIAQHLSKTDGRTPEKEVGESAGEQAGLISAHHGRLH
ncbi:MAG: alginate O-acetyltransferase AlgX-related protein, partial [Nitrospiraceae bacterium]